MRSGGRQRQRRATVGDDRRRPQCRRRSATSRTAAASCTPVHAGVVRRRYHCRPWLVSRSSARLASIRSASSVQLLDAVEARRRRQCSLTWRAARRLVGTAGSAATGVAPRRSSRAPASRTRCRQALQSSDVRTPPSGDRRRGRFTARSSARAPSANPCPCRRILDAPRVVAGRESSTATMRSRTRDQRCGIRPDGPPELLQEGSLAVARLIRARPGDVAQGGTVSLP